MVVAGGESEHVEEKTKEKTLMTTTPQRSRTLHNFSLPCLKWGKQKHLRCMKVPDSDHISSLYRRSPPSGSGIHRDSGELFRMQSEPETSRRSLSKPEYFENSPSQPPTREIGSKSLLNGDYDNGIEAIRAKLMLDFQTEVDRMKVAILSEGDKVTEPLRTEVAVAATAADIRPWILRTRKALRKEPDVNGGVFGGSGGGTCQRVDEWKPNFPPTTTNENKLPRLRSKVGGENGRNGGEKRSRPEFSVSLSKQDIEHDFSAIVGTRPPRRPKKRSRCVQKQLDTLFPGLWLSEITPDMYQVNENLNAGKS
ncbi:hypothetical protein Nepgr_003750 [Nepenthes gracilis]|uniref:Uncharacterized protein n=1 Tax=Nepenthes gracilis TaxID=150966 RepID=A0AAD3S049_NEPGR|nr:hypothetical protein Nepgr_003750 [Nepenthes gracilis]